MVSTITARNQLSAGALTNNHLVRNFYEDHRDLVTRTWARVGSTHRSRTDAVYNEIGQRTAVGVDGNIMGGSDGSYYYQYNSKGEVVKMQRHSSPATNKTSNFSHTQNYGFDEIGNRLTADHSSVYTSVSSGSWSYTPSLLNQYSSITTDGVTVSKSHDEDGNLIDDGSKVYDWDAENRLQKVSNQSGVTLAEYYYDYRGRRIGKITYPQAEGGESVILFYYDGWNLLAEIDLNTDQVLRKYTWGTDLSGTKQGAGGVGGLLCVEDDEGKHYPTYDVNGNVVGVIGDDAGATGQAWFTYDPFGEGLAGAEVTGGGPYRDKMKFRFSTKDYDEETGFYYYGRRYYDPQTGRWSSRDPINESGGLNIYGFVGNDGIGRVDFLGFKISPFPTPTPTTPASPFPTPTPIQPGSLPPPATPSPTLMARTVKFGMWGVLVIEVVWICDSLYSIDQDLDSIAESKRQTERIERETEESRRRIKEIIEDYAWEAVESSDWSWLRDLKEEWEALGFGPFPWSFGERRTPEENKKARNKWKNHKDKCRKAWELKNKRDWPLDKYGNPWPGEHVIPLKEGGTPLKLNRGILIKKTLTIYQGLMG